MLMPRLRFSITLPPTLPRNGITSIGRLTYWLVGTIEGQSDGKKTSKPITRSSASSSTLPSAGPSSPSSGPSTSALPSYTDPGSNPVDVKWLRGLIRSERRIAISHNPNPEGGVSRLDDDFKHDLPDFGTCRIQVRVNEVSI